MNENNMLIKRETRKLEQKIREQDKYFSHLTEIIHLLQKKYRESCETVNIKDYYQMSVHENGNIGFTHNYRKLKAKKKTDSDEDNINISKSKNKDDFSEEIKHKLEFLNKLPYNKEHHHLIKRKFEEEVREHRSLKESHRNKKSQFVKLKEIEKKLEKEIKTINNVT